MADTSATGSAPLPARARIVIIGGGVGGASVAHHLAERGERDVLLVERAELTSGSTFHSAGLVGQLRADPALTRMNAWSAALYRRLEEAGGDGAPGWVESGSLRLASSPLRLVEIRRQAAWARRAGLPLELVSAKEAADLFPLMSTDGVLGAAYTPTDGQVDPARLCYALAASARAGGVTIAQRTRVTAITTHEGRVTGVRTDRGEVECEVVVDCGGMFAAEIARLAGVRVPIVPMSHQYVVTEPFLPAGTGPLPSLRDPDLLVYYRQEVEGLVMGGYERQSAPFTATATSFDAVPADFNGRLLPADWDRFAEIVENAQVRVPALADTGVRTMVNGPEGFTPDNEFCLGETDVGGFFVAAGFCAHGIAGAGGIGQVMAAWILDGDPGLDVWHMDVRRFGPEYRSPGYTLARVVENYESYYDIRPPGSQRRAGRPLRTSPAYPWHAAHGAVFGEKAGWERVEYYVAEDWAQGSGAAADDGAPRGWAGHGWSPWVLPEHRAAREAAALFDESSFAKIEITGPEAAAFVAHAFAGRVDGPPGSLAYTQALDDRGGVAMDVTVSRVAPDAFLVVTGTASGRHDLAWLRDRARATGNAVRIADVSGAWACFGLWGPRARDVLAPLHARGPVERGVPVPDHAGDDGRRRPGARAAGDLCRRARLGAVLPDGVRRRAVAKRSSRPGPRTGCGPRATGRSRACGWRRGTGSGDPTSPVTPLRTRRAWRSRCVRATGTPERRRWRQPARAGRRGACGASCSTTRAPSRWGRSRCGLRRTTSPGSSPRVATATPSSGRSPTPCCPVEVGPGTAVQVQVDGEWVDAEVVRGPLYDPKGSASGRDPPFGT